MKKEKKFSIGNFFKKYYKYIFLAIGITGILVMVLTSDLGGVQWSLFATSDFALLLAECFGVWFLIYVLHTITYRIILEKEGKNIDSFHLFKITMTGFALNNVTPAGLIGGEPYRIMELKKYVSTEKSASATFSFTVLYAIGHLMLWDAGFITYIFMGMPGSAVIDILMIITGGFNVIATFCLIFLRVNIVYPFMHLLTKLPFIGKKLVPLVERNAATFKEIDNLINTFHKKWLKFFTVLLIQFGTRLLEALEYFLIIRFFVNGVATITYWQGLSVMATCSLIGNLLFIIPMQAGSREGGMAIALHFLFGDDLVSTIAVPVGLVYRVREFTCTLIGIIMVAATRRIRKEKEIAAPVETVEVVEEEKPSEEKVEIEEK
ncbi:MAG: flippase-like domain-containing protein [Bacilli bacterium]|nr:flippase-like domain-containing protein [Bacilli bacterium]